MRIFTGVFRTFSRPRKSAESGRQVTAGVVAHSSSRTLAACEVPHPRGGAAPDFRPLRVSTSLQLGRVGCADRCTFAHSWAELPRFVLSCGGGGGEWAWWERGGGGGKREAGGLRWGGSWCCKCSSSVDIRVINSDKTVPPIQSIL